MTTVHIQKKRKYFYISLVKDNTAYGRYEWTIPEKLATLDEAIHYAHRIASENDYSLSGTIKQFN